MGRAGESLGGIKKGMREREGRQLFTLGLGDRGTLLLASLVAFCSILRSVHIPFTGSPT